MSQTISLWLCVWLDDENRPSRVMTVRARASVLALSAAQKRVGRPPHFIHWMKEVAA
jgi:hypothetical protein